jgi:hypothetical protein
MRDDVKDRDVRQDGPGEGVARIVPLRPASSPLPAGHPEADPRGQGERAVTFDRHELRAIMDVYGRKVAAGEWRDYAIDFTPRQAVFSVFRRASEMPLYRIIKDPALRNRQGAYGVVTAGGVMLKRGADLGRVLRVLESRLSVVG